ncbi:hypothetical protein [Simkania sp.]|uniref:hypothetical protein n=1 Tax=Simkania sp. TaxID=34094 RepID=UPI003B518EB9
MAQYEDEFNASICLSPPPNPSDGPREIFKKLLKTITDECNVITQDADVYTLSFDASGEITATFKERAPIPNRFHLTPIPSNRDPIPLSYLVSCNSVQFAKKTGECYRLELDSDGKIIARFTKKIKTNSPEDTKPSYSSSCKFMTIALLGVISVVALSVFQGLHSQHEL